MRLSRYTEFEVVLLEVWRRTFPISFSAALLVFRKVPFPERAQLAASLGSLLTVPEDPVSPGAHPGDGAHAGAGSSDSFAYSSTSRARAWDEPPSFGDAQRAFHAWLRDHAVSSASSMRVEALRRASGTTLTCDEVVVELRRLGVGAVAGGVVTGLTVSTSVVETPMAFAAHASLGATLSSEAAPSLPPSPSPPAVAHPGNPLDPSHPEEVLVGPIEVDISRPQEPLDGGDGPTEEDYAVAASMPRLQAALRACVRSCGTDDRKAVESAVDAALRETYAIRGRVDEDENLDAFGALVVSEVSCRSETYIWRPPVVHPMAGPWVISCRLDGRLANGRVVEMKSRQRQISRFKPMENLAQLQVYLNTDPTCPEATRQGYLVQILGRSVAGKKRVAYIRAPPNRAWWISTCLPALHAFVADVRRLGRGEHVFQLALMSRYNQLASRHKVLK